MNNQNIEFDPKLELEYIDTELFGSICYFRLDEYDYENIKDEEIGDYLYGAKIGDWVIEEGGVICGKGYFEHQRDTQNLKKEVL